MELISVKEVARLVVIRQVLDKQLKQTQPAHKLSLSVRQIKRLSSFVRKQGEWD